MRHRKLVKIIASILILMAVILGISFNQVCKNIEGYKEHRAYEDLSYTERLVVKIKGYTIYTRDDLRKIEASKIVTTFKKISSLNQLYDINNKNIIDEEIKEHDKILEELHKENSSGNITDESLKNIMDNCISAVENHKKSLEAFKSGDLQTYSNFSSQVDKDAIEIRNEAERLGLKK
ncbi:hypothetical protein [Clostridium sp. YIM B02555]|uniref:hypothetical protein n=1 Tax=Clostridium sp. YIM B02555 TaxID=2911968 RepID=UPI001EED5C1A|nr:hypothetical protein [Clostridium sp. YIM B02555]